MKISKQQTTGNTKNYNLFIYFMLIKPMPNFGQLLLPSFSFSFALLFEGETLSHD